MSWQPELDELAQRTAFAKQMGGADKVKRQHDGGRLTVRERIEKLADAGSFHEVGAIAGKAEYDAEGKLVELTPSNCVWGRATLDGRRVVLVDKTHHPRFHIGESLLPANVQLFDRLGLRSELERIGMRKWGIEFISTEHTAKNLMITATKRAKPSDTASSGAAARELAAFYGIQTQRLAERLGFSLAPA